MSEPQLNESALPPPLTRADQAVSMFYWYLFNKKIGAEFHAFIEWCGVMSVYLDMVRDTGLELHTLNNHSRIAVNVQAHQMYYLAEKLNCILAPFLNAASPEVKERFVKILFEGE